jgi:2-C-methyl-D-erythritol 4-phosphate cytidylyltransferase
MTTLQTHGVWSIVVAGGSGRRFGSAKQFEPLDETSGAPRVVDQAVAVAAAVGPVVLVVPGPDLDEIAVDLIERSGAGHSVTVVAGGDSRTASVRCGLDRVPDSATVICVHDAARPFATPALFEAVIAAIGDQVVAAVPGVAVTDTIKVVDADSMVLDTPARHSLVAVQTPQAFSADVLRAAHRRAAEAEHEGTDDAALVEWMTDQHGESARIAVVDGEADNRKITHRDDLDWARRYWAQHRSQH